MALANIGLDLLGQARSLYSYAAEVEAAGHDEDGFAYLRDAPQYRNLLLLEQVNGDFAQTLVRQFFYSAFADPYWRAMMRSTDPTLAAVAAKSEKESAYHLRHSSEWMIRLGRWDGREPPPRAGCGEHCCGLTPARCSSQKMPPWPALPPIDPTSLRPEWQRTVDDILAQATLSTCRKAPGCIVVGAPGDTPSISAPCWRRCNTCSAATPARDGEPCWTVHGMSLERLSIRKSRC